MLDSLEIFKELKQSFSEEQASMLSRMFKETIDFHLEDLSTKRDLKELETRLQHDIKEMEIGLKRDMAELKADIIKWVVGLLLVQSGIIVGGFFAAVKILMEK